MRLRIGTRRTPDVDGMALCLLQHGVIVTGDGPTRTLDFPIGDIARESKRLLRCALGQIADEAFCAYGAEALLFELFINLAKVSFALGDRSVTQVTLADGLAHWQPGASMMRDARVLAHHTLLRAWAEADRHHRAPPPPGRARWMFLWGRPIQNRSMALLRAECEAERDSVLDLRLHVRIAGRSVRETTIPEPWARRGYEVWRYRRIPLHAALQRATTLAQAICAWAWDWKRIELDPRSVVRAMLYDVVLGDALEGLVAALAPEALVCSMVWGLGYQVAHRANVRCVEFLHGSIEEGLAQPMVPRPREIVGATNEDLEWIAARGEQRFVQLLGSDPATEKARRRRAQRARDHRSLCVAYFPTYTAGVFGGSDKTRAAEDEIVRALAKAQPEIRWLLKPHPGDAGAVERFGWIKGLANMELVDAQRDAMELLAEIDAGLHCGSSLGQQLGQLGIPQIEIALEGRLLSTALPPRTTVITEWQQALPVLRSLVREDAAPAVMPELSLRERILIRTPRTEHDEHQ